MPASSSADSLLPRLATGLAVGTLVGFFVVDLSLASLVPFYWDKSYLVPAIAVPLAFAWLAPLLRRLVAAGTVLLGVLWLAVCFTPLSAWLADGLVRRDAIEDADAVFVFASRIQEDGDPTTDAMSRLLKGVELVAAGRAPILIVSEIPAPAGPYAPLAREWLRRFAGRGEVLVVGRVLNTRDEAVALAKLARERGLQRILAVTSPTHTRRAAATLEKVGLTAISVPAVETNFDLERLRFPGDRRRAFGTIAHERVGLVYYRRRGWID